jgi:hypothetical protein
MGKKPEDFDEYQLAEYLAGNLSAVERSQVSAYLAGDASARELLSMAGEAMDAASAPETESRKRRQGVRTRPPFMLQSQRSLMRLVVGLVVLTIALGFALFLHILEDMVPGTPDVPSIEVQWTPILRSDHFSISWSAVEGADAYVVVVMDPTSEHLVARIETDNTSIPNLFDRPVNEAALTRSSIPRSGEILDLWISAFDHRGNLLRRSDRIPFVAEP